jgi:hypothetical protein
MKRNFFPKKKIHLQRFYFHALVMLKRVLSGRCSRQMILLLRFEQLITLEHISFGNDTQKNPPCPSQSRRQVFCTLYSLDEEDSLQILPSTQRFEKSGIIFWIFPLVRLEPGELVTRPRVEIREILRAWSAECLPVLLPR